MTVPPTDPTKIDSAPHGRAHEMLLPLPRETFTYFERWTNPNNDLIADGTEPGSPSSIAAIGLGLISYIVAIERGLMERERAAQRTLAMLRFLHQSPQSEDADATGYKGCYYHFLDMSTGRRAWKCELSTIETASCITPRTDGVDGERRAGADHSRRRREAA
jgi:hypothetical protein